MPVPVLSLEELTAFHECMSIASRIRILNLIHARQPICSRDIERVTGFPQGFTTRHLTYIKARRLIVFQKAYNYHFFSINPKFVNVLDYSLTSVSGDPQIKTDLDTHRRIRKDLVNTTPLDNV